MELFAPTWSPVSPREFLELWEPLYNYNDESIYDAAVEAPLTRDTIVAAFRWKNGGRLSRRTRASVEVNFADRLDELRSLPKDTSAGDFLDRFADGGAIFRIFWLHLWQPDRFPIFDQHVYRAMAALSTGRVAEIPAYDPKKISAYGTEYVPFVRSIFDGLPLRRVDRALWTCGRALKLFDVARLDELPCLPTPRD